jgi:hypothetical protein
MIQANADCMQLTSTVCSALCRISWHTAALHWCSTERAGREDGEKVEERKGERGRRERKASQRATIRSDRYIIHGTQNRRTTDEATGGGAANINSTAEAGTVTPHDTAAHASQHHKGRHSVQSRRKGKE